MRLSASPAVGPRGGGSKALGSRMHTIHVTVHPSKWRCGVELQSQELQRKEEELKQRDAFYKEQLARIEQKVRLRCFLFAVAEY
ncbi:UNVERIFIED_CONTAM: hypothetical protein K2H54_051496 [Gekko kuhli]